MAYRASRFIGTKVSSEAEEVNKPIEMTKNDDADMVRNTAVMLAKCADSPNIHLLDWLETAPSDRKHIIQHFMDKLKAVDSRSDISPTQKQVLQLSMREALKNFLAQCNTLVPKELQGIYLYSEDSGTTGLLKDVEESSDGPAEWYTAILQHSATDRFLHSATHRPFFDPMNDISTSGSLKQRVVLGSAKIMSYIAAAFYPIIYISIMFLHCLESYKNPCQKKIGARMRQIRLKIEACFSTPSMLFYMKWCTDAWILILLILYIESIYGGGYDRLEPCYCGEPSWPAPRTGDPDSRCAIQALDSLHWLACHDPSENYTEWRKDWPDHCNRRWNRAITYPYYILAGDNYTREAWSADRKQPGMILTSYFIKGFIKSHYTECTHYKQASKAFGGNSSTASVEEIFKAYRSMYKDSTREHWLYWNRTTAVTLLVLLYILVTGKVIQELHRFINTGCCTAKYFIDKANTITFIQLLSLNIYLACEVYSVDIRIHEFGVDADVWYGYEITTRTAQLIGLIATIILVISVAPKHNMYTQEINSILDMLVLGLRYLSIIMVFLLGLFFIAQSLERRNIINDRDLTLMWTEFTAEKALTADLPYATRQAISKVFRFPFGLLNSASEARIYDESSRKNYNIDIKASLATFVFWIIFAILIVVIGFNGLVAYMSANLKFGDAWDDLAELTVTRNIMRYACSKLQPKHIYWPSPFNVFAYLVEASEPRYKSHRLSEPLSNGAADTMTRTVICYLTENEDAEFRSTLGQTLTAIISKQSPSSQPREDDDVPMYDNKAFR